MIDCLCSSRFRGELHIIGQKLQKAITEAIGLYGQHATCSRQGVWGVGIGARMGGVGSGVEQRKHAQLCVILDHLETEMVYIFKQCHVTMLLHSCLIRTIQKAQSLCTSTFNSITSGADSP